MESVNSNGIQIMQYLDAALRRKWLILIPFVLVSSAAGYYSTTLPPIYRSDTTILVEPQQVPENYVQSTVTGSVQDRLNTISQQILSRTRLETVVKELNLYTDLIKRTSMEAVVGEMRNNIDINVERSARHRGATAAFKLSFYGKDPAVVQRVTQKLAMLYIEENLRVRETLARGTKDFMEKQLQEIEGALNKREEAIREFKQQYMGELPEQLEANLRSLDQLQEQKSSAQDSLRDAEDRQVLLEQQLVETPRYLAGAGTDQEDLYRQLEARRQELTSLMTRYTERYPDVIRLKKEIQQLELRIVTNRPDGQDTTTDSVPILNPTYTRLKEQVDTNRLNIENLREEIQTITLRMRTAQQRVENTPQREQELMTLSRDYETIKQSYESMMERKINAEIAENLEVRQKSEQFRILDPANHPRSPVRPNRMKFVFMGIALGLGIGGGLAFGAEYLDRSFRTVEEVKDYFSIPLLGAVPALATSEELRRRKIRKLALASFGMGFFLTAVVGVHFFVARLDTILMSLVKTIL